MDIPSGKNSSDIKILIISLASYGNVLSSTSILPAIKRKFSTSIIYWLTFPQSEEILQNNPYINKLFIWSEENKMILRSIEFDYVFNADKSVYACAFANETKAKNKFGFLLNEDGKIIPANENAYYSYRLGLDDELKFRKNQKTDIEILHETFDLDYQNDEYVFNFTEEELKFIEEYKTQIEYDNGFTYVGFNTGCSDIFPNKKMSLEQHIQIISELLFYDNLKIVLLGGKDDAERNKVIYETFSDFHDERIFNTPVDESIRRGACYMDICDIVITGDSFGMHLAIALKKYVIVWFGLSSAAEVELFGHGVKLIPEGLECSPCMKRVCPYNLECISMIDLKAMKDAVINFSLNKPSFSN